VPDAELSLTTHRRISGTTFQEVRIGTNAKGEFVITNVPAGRVWDLSAKMDSLAPKGLTAPVAFVETKDDGQEIAVGDIEARPGHAVRGRIVLSDGASIPPGMRVSLSADQGSDRQVQVLPPDGKFEFKGLGRGVYNLTPAVKGYQVRGAEYGVEFLVEGDRDNFNVTMQAVN
jgi:hypothetical protein